MVGKIMTPPYKDAYILVTKYINLLIYTAKGLLQEIIKSLPCTLQSFLDYLGGFHVMTSVLIKGIQKR